MDIFGDGGIGFHRARLVRVIGELMALAGLCPGASVAPGFTLPRYLRAHINRLLRPAESALRRLVLIAAARLSVTVRHAPARPPKLPARRHGPVIAPVLPPKPVRRPRAPRPERPAGGELVVTLSAEGEGGRARRKPASAAAGPAGGAPGGGLPAFPLVDARKSFDDRPRHLHPRHMPQVRGLVSLPVYMRRPEPPAWRPPLPDDDVSAERLGRRLLAAARALGNIDAEARRMARREALRRHRPPGRGGLPPMRPGAPPGRCRRSRHLVHDILADCHYRALHPLEPPGGPSRADSI